MERVYRPILLSIFGNVLLAGVKVGVGVLYSSIGLVSDGIHSLSDTITSIIGYVGLKISSKPADRGHPFGHSRFESLFAFFIGIALLLVAYEIARDSIWRIGRGLSIEVNALMLSVTLISILSKEAMARYSLAVGKRLNNAILIADAHHHRSDSLSSVAVLVGLCLQKAGFPYGDSIAGLVVALLVAKAAIEIVRTNVNYLTGTSPPFEVCERIKEAALGVEGVEGVHDLRAHYVGPKLHVELHIEVSPERTLKEGHDISEEVKRRIEEIPDVDVAFVHVDIKGITE